MPKHLFSLAMALSALCDSGLPPFVLRRDSTLVFIEGGCWAAEPTPYRSQRRLVMSINDSKVKHSCSGKASFPSAIHELPNLDNWRACPEVKTGRALEIAVNNSGNNKLRLLTRKKM